MEGHVMLHTQSSFFVEGLSSSNRCVEKHSDILRQLINLREIVVSHSLVVECHQGMVRIFKFTKRNAQTPRYAQAQNSLNTREFCETSKNGKDVMFKYVARTCCLYISYNQNMSLLQIIWK